MKQTAVEWLFEKMTEQGTNPYWDMRFKEAKEMEKEQIIKAWLATDYPLQRIWAAEEYFNETYGDK